MVKGERREGGEGREKRGRKAERESEGGRERGEVDEITENKS